MPEYVFVSNKAKCNLPDVERAPQGNFVQDCDIPDPPPPIAEPPDPELPILPDFPECPEIQFSGGVTLASGETSLTITGGRVEVAACEQQQCPYEFVFDFVLDIDQVAGPPGDPGPCTAISAATTAVTSSTVSSPQVQVVVSQPDPELCFHLFEFFFQFPDLSSSGISPPMYKELKPRRFRTSTKVKRCGEGTAALLSDAEGVEDCECGEDPEATAVPLVDRTGLAATEYNSTDGWHIPPNTMGTARYSPCEDKYEIISIGNDCCAGSPPLGDHIYVKPINDIPRRQDEVPGGGDAKVYLIDENEILQDTGQTKRILNIGVTPLAKDKYYQASKDQYGHYVVSEHLARYVDVKLTQTGGSNGVWTYSVRDPDTDIVLLSGGAPMNNVNPTSGIHGWARVTGGAYTKATKGTAWWNGDTYALRWINEALDIYNCTT